MTDLAKRFPQNPLLRPSDLKPSRPDWQVECLLNPGAFRFDGSIRMSTQTDLERYLDVTKETFTSMYDLQVSPISTLAMKPFHVPYILFRRDMVSFAGRSA